MKTIPLKSKGELRTKNYIIPYRIYGNGGPPIVCLNGAQQSMAMWHSFVTQLSDHYKIVLFDFPGQGKARSINGNGQHRVSLDEQVEILENVMSVSGVNGNTTICAASWGGVVAIAFASKHGKSVRRLVLGSLGTKPNKKMVDTIVKGCNIEEKDRQKMADILIESFGQNLPDTIKRRIETQFRSMSPEKLKAFSEHGMFVISAKSLDDLIDLKRVKTETVLISGENDTILDLDDVKYLATQIPNCKHKIVKDVGHFLHLEREDVIDVYRAAIQN